MSIQWTQVNNDANGNPRYVCHFLNFMRPWEKADYNLALSRARTALHSATSPPMPTDAKKRF